MSNALTAQAQAIQQAMQAQANYAGICGLPSGLSGGLTSAVTVGTGSTNLSYTIAGLYDTGYQANPYTPAAAIAPAKDDEFSWLRKRVEDVCWKQAA